MNKNEGYHQYFEKVKSYRKQNVCYICKKEFSNDNDNGTPSNKKYHKGQGYYRYTENIDALLIIFVT